MALQHVLEMIAFKCITSTSMHVYVRSVVRDCADVVLTKQNIVAPIQAAQLHLLFVPVLTVTGSIPNDARKVQIICVMHIKDRLLRFPSHELHKRYMFYMLIIMTKVEEDLLINSKEYKVYKYRGALTVADFKRQERLCAVFCILIRLVLNIGLQQYYFYFFNIEQFIMNTLQRIQGVYYLSVKIGFFCSLGRMVGQQYLIKIFLKEILER
eukprot:TRINITY_DN3948_c0_g1_i6.p1 TRINITY_DN3948_c0_g1~~TRINITY_DN3948_c0_g1_i6.p1  ORF type:complete len:211 (+),score=3.45 TRINITY_DN3948_c0_g1_i6:327-959(+)